MQWALWRKGIPAMPMKRSDIVCAAISALTQAVVIGLNEVIGLQTALEIEDGYIYCMLPKAVSEKHGMMRN